MGKRHVIWSNMDMKLEDWINDLKEDERLNGNDPDSFGDDYYVEQMHERNQEYLDDARDNLSKQFYSPIVVFADLGLWYGRRFGFIEIKSGLLRDCLSDSDCDYAEWFVDSKGDLCFQGRHHDGTNRYLYRLLKTDLSEKQLDNFYSKLHELVYGNKGYSIDSPEVKQFMRLYTVKLGDFISDVYEW